MSIPIPTTAPTQPAPHARDVQPWTDCGPRSSPDFGTLFADAPYRGEVGLWFNRKLTHFACRAGADIGDSFELDGRRFDVVRIGDAVALRSEAA